MLLRKQKARAFIFVNGKLDMHRVVKIEDWMDLKTMKPAKVHPVIGYKTSITSKGIVDVECTCAYISVFSARAGGGLFMSISLYNPIMNKMNFPLQTLAECRDPEKLEAVPYA